MSKSLQFSETGKVREFRVEEDCVSIGVDYNNGGSQYGSFPLEDKYKLEKLFPVGEKIKALFDSPDPWKGRLIQGLVNINNGQEYITDSIWKRKYYENQKKRWEEASKKEHERMMAIPEYKYQSKYQFPDDMDISGNRKEDGEGFRNSIHLSISRGMEFMENKDPKDFSMKTSEQIVGVSEDNKNVEKLKDHIEKCVTKELGSEWGHSGFSMIYAVGQVLKAKELGWDNYIQWIRTWKSKKEE